MTDLDDMRVAVVHEWLSAKAGSEFVFEQLAEAFPAADLFALTREPSLSFAEPGRPIRTTFLQRSATARHRRDLTLPLMPVAWKTIGGRGTYDLVITSAHAFAREFPLADARHLSYVHAPMRYAWSPELDPRSLTNSIAGRATRAMLRRADRRRIHTVDQMVANSSEVAGRIMAFYGRSAEVVHPPVQVEDLLDRPVRRQGYALALSRWIPYKRIDIAIEASAMASVPLVVAGSGPEEQRLRDLARRLGGDVRFVVQPSREEVADLLSGASVFVFPPHEDFGIVAIEAQAAGVPVVALAAGGALDTVRDGATGVLAPSQTTEHFWLALQKCLALDISADECRQHATDFRPERFRTRIRDIAAEVLQGDGDDQGHLGDTASVHAASSVDLRPISQGETAVNAQKILMLEVNEVPFKVLDDYVARHPASALARFVGDGRQFETVCEDQIELDPWISWPTLHRGVRDIDHRILHLAQDLHGADAAFPPIWDLLGRAGVSYGVFGSLHAELEGSPPGSCAFHVPDVFAADPAAFPSHLQSFQAFNLTMTRKSGRNVDRSIPLTELTRFAFGYLRSSVSVATLRAAAKVLLAERLKPHLACRRRSIQPLVAFDVFERELLRSQPSFATFHTNHVAAALHRYWAAAYPDDIARNKMPPEWRRRYGGEVDFTLAILDQIVARIMAGPANNGYKVILATSLGQAGVTSRPSPGFRTIVDLQRFMEGLGFPAGSWTEGHAMVPNISIRMAAGQGDEFERRLLDLRVGGFTPYRSDTEVPPFTYTRVNDSFQLYLYFEGLCTALDVERNGHSMDEDEIGVGFMAHQDGIACSGRHTPQGSMIVYQSGQRAMSDRGRISTLDIAPAILRHFGAEVPGYMKEPEPFLLEVEDTSVVDLVLSEGGGVERPVVLA